MQSQDNGGGSPLSKSQNGSQAVKEESKHHPGELELPDVHDEPKAIELLRLWYSDGHCRMIHRAAKLPASGWGEDLAFVIREVAETLADWSGGKVKDVMQEIRQSFEKQLAESGEPQATGAVN